MNMKNIIQYHPDGTAYQKWRLYTKDGMVRRFSRFTMEGELASVGRFGSPIESGFFDSPPSKFMEDIKKKHGDIKEYKFSYHNSPSKWGWLVETESDQIIIVPAGWWVAGPPLLGGTGEATEGSE